MKIGVLIGSITGNTEHLGNQIIKKLQDLDGTLKFDTLMINQEMNKMNTAEQYQYPNYDAYVVGTYTDFLSIPILVRQYFEKMPPTHIKNKLVLTFSTHGFTTGHTGQALQQLLISMGAKPISHIVTKYPDNYVHLPFILPLYLKKVQKNSDPEFDSKCIHFVNTLKSGKFPEITTKYNSKNVSKDVQRQKKQVKDHFIVQDSCVGCGSCVENCPSAIISLKDGKAVFTEHDKCIGCYSCFQKCPVNAIVDEKKTLANTQQYKYDNSYIVEKPKSNSMFKALIFVTFMMLTVMLLK
ncbi:4Fe-4S_ferredoxin iron-sulfur binding domain protein [Hexamita inflata]|uniref:4Fe-4S ferredoxin iron-sulfur binding domain protein n=1 Tax=Hexamita inflata TaxID=28002 RepID=A0AA86NAN0_9EUKA|nr:4Fe-4S ferredoxin iron-sulfur binding domain protein [Hexamita inflata]